MYFPADIRKLLLTRNKYIAKNKMKQNTYLPSLIKIYCLQLHETIDSSVYRRLLAVCPGIDKNERKTYIYEYMNCIQNILFL